MYITTYLLISSMIAIVAVKDFNETVEKKSTIWSIGVFFFFLFCWPIALLWVVSFIIINRLKK